MSDRVSKLNTTLADVENALLRKKNDSLELLVVGASELIGDDDDDDDEGDDSEDE